MTARVLLFTTAWTLFAFAGAYRWTLVPLVAGVAVLVVLAPPRIASRGTRLLDLALAAGLTAVALQLIPLPVNVRLAIAPSSIAYEQAARVPAGGASTPTAAPGPISVNPAATRVALFMLAVTLLLYWASRTAMRRGGVRRTMRGLAWMGAIVAPLAIVQHTLAPQLFYLRWPSHIGNALPYTPFMNRNDFASWLVMAIPMTAGYAIARVQSRRRPGQPFDPESALDDTGMLLGVSLFVMNAGLLASMSRSGLAGATAGLVLFILLSRGRMSTRWIAAMVGALTAMVVLAAFYANIHLLAARLGGIASEGLAGRIAIWRQTWPMVRDFWPVGSGVGTYQQVMVLYQTMSRLFYLSHADNELLQIVAEGGALVGIPAAVAIAAAVTAIARRLRADHTPMYWVRAGAASGLLAAAVQNLWEMTLRVPANAVLLAVLAAVATHDSAARSHEEHRHGREHREN